MAECEIAGLMCYAPWQIAVSTFLAIGLGWALRSMVTRVRL